MNRIHYSCYYSYLEIIFVSLCIYEKNICNGLWTISYEFKRPVYPRSHRLARQNTKKSISSHHYNGWIIFPNVHIFRTLHAQREREREALDGQPASSQFKHTRFRISFLWLVDSLSRPPLVISGLMDLNRSSKPWDLRAHASRHFNEWTVVGGN